jgi:hypothetical protein
LALAVAVYAVPICKFVKITVNLLKRPINIALESFKIISFYYFILSIYLFFVVLGLELRAFTLSNSTSRFL